VSPWGLRENEPNVANYHPETPGGQTFKTLVDFILYVRAVQCPACKQTFFRSELDVSMMLQNWKSSKVVLTSFLRCARCSTSFCIACTPQPSARWSDVSVQGKQVSWCCAGGRLFLLWLLLCGFDEHFSAAKLKEANHRKPDQQLQPEKNNNKKKARQTERGGGVGFGGPARHPTPASAFMPSGKGYGSDMADYSSWGVGHTLSRHRFDPNATNINSKAKALSAQFTEDYFYGLHLQLIEGLLPSFERESSFDFDPPDSLAEMLIESKILNYCTELLRNDSVEDATKRKSVYQALMSFLRTLGAHYITASSAIYNERPSREDKINLLVLSFQGLPGATSEKSSSLLNSLSNLNTQSELVLREAKSNEKEFGTPDGQNLLLLCRQISDLRQYLVANSGSYGEADSSQSKTEIPVLTDLPDVEVFASHAYASPARALQSTPAGRFKRLITEITTLKTGLPPGIFVRYAESRPDVQKVAIIGPVGTPYENGIFEFDFFCDANFPNKPPLVQFKTTGGGRVPFNPNLYADGKVCLSLLGTWQGESLKFSGYIYII
jgi:ubiquitin-protein ligase